jgi:GDP-D-mannose dehydratase
MPAPAALITGVSGQDGRRFAHAVLADGATVWAASCRGTRLMLDFGALVDLTVDGELTRSAAEAAS